MEDVRSPAAQGGARPRTGGAHPPTGRNRSRSRPRPRKNRETDPETQQPSQPNARPDKQQQAPSGPRQARGCTPTRGPTPTSGPTPVRGRTPTRGPILTRGPTPVRGPTPARETAGTEADGQWTRVGKQRKNWNGPKRDENREQMEQSKEVKDFLHGKLFKSKTKITDKQFLRFVKEATVVEKNNPNVRHQFLIRLTRSTFLESAGPIFKTIIQLTNEQMNETIKEALITLLEVLDEMLVRIPHCQNTFPYCITIMGLIEKVPLLDKEARDRITSLREIHLRDPNELYKKIHEPQQQWTPDLSFISEDIIPETMNDLHKRLDARFENTLHGEYKSSAHYLETWFRLMKEDFFGPLSKAIKDFKAQIRMNNNQLPKNVRIDGGYYYKMTNIVDVDTIDGDVCYKLKFSLDELKHVDWNTTGRQKFDSMILLSDDNFRTAHYGIIMRHDHKPAKPHRGLVWVKRIRGNFQLKMPCHAIEPMPFYEPYRCVLERLKIMGAKLHKGVEVPMNRYIVKSSKNVERPTYLRSVGVLKLPRGESVDARDIRVNLNLDSSQRSALNLALTNEFTLIQGPPGTGKSYVGAMFVHIMMLNKQLWQRYDQGCILLMAYKNHAIDQFIGECEGMGVDMKNTVRVGGGGGLAVQKYLLRNKRRQLSREDGFIYGNVVRLRNKLKQIGNEMATFLLIQKYKDEDMPLEHFEQYVPNHFWHQWGQVEHRKEYEPRIYFWATGREKTDTPKTEENGARSQRQTDEDSEDEEEQGPTARNDTELLEFRQADAISRCNNIHTINPNDRRRLFHYWCERAREDAGACVEDYSQWQRDVQAEYMKLIRQQDITVVKRADIIAMTTTGASKHGHLIDAVRPTIVLVEEAAEILESHIVAPLTEGCKHVVLIGDHQQLRPSIENYSLEKRNMHISLFERMIMNGVPSRRLQFQHRMHPKIARILVPHIYESLENHEIVHSYPEVRGLTKRMLFLSHDHQEEKVGEKSSCRNKFEAEYLVALCHYLLQQNYSPSDITILVAYMGQLRLVKQRIDEYSQKYPEPQYTKAEMKDLIDEEFSDYLESMKPYSGIRLSTDMQLRQKKRYEMALKRLDGPMPKLKGVRVSTVDNYQGEESNIILLSFVRSNSRCNIGFLSRANRICVALSRAKHGFYAVGDFNLFAQSPQSDLWKKLCEQLKTGDEISLDDKLQIRCTNHGTVQELDDARLFKELAPMGGCTKPCDVRLECGHVCARLCHSFDLDHAKFICEKPCTSKLDCGHRCPKLCYQTGDDEGTAKHFYEGNLRTCLFCKKKVDCREQIDIQPECGHPGRTMCSRSNLYVCREPKPHQLECGHTKIAPCSIDPSRLVCTEIELYTRECGHLIHRLCVDKNKPLGKCEEIVTVALDCKHRKRVQCHSKELVGSDSCKETVNIELECTHKKNVQCKDRHNTTRQLCDRQVPVTLPCNHTTTVLCSKATDPLPQCLMNEPVKLSCGHYVQKLCSTPAPPCQKLQKIDLPCGHPHQVACNRLPGLTQSPQLLKSIQCKIKKPVKLKCGHTADVECHEKDTDSIQCKVRKEEKLDCGHTVHRECHDKNTKKCTIVKKETRKCGHFIKAECHDFENQKMKECASTKKIFKDCGHKAEVKCKEMSSETTAQCTEPCLVTCSHQQVCPRECNERCIRCPKPCENMCPHSKCTRRCYEECDRVPCNQPCRKQRRCGHVCAGICGELCPTECVQCRPSARKGRRIRIKPCNHDFLPQQLDEHMKVHDTASWQKVEIKHCPVCNSVISYCPRYANQIKRYQLLSKHRNNIAEESWWFCIRGGHFLRRPQVHDCQMYEHLSINLMYSTEDHPNQREVDHLVRTPTALANNDLYDRVQGRQHRKKNASKEARRPPLAKLLTSERVPYQAELADDTVDFDIDLDEFTSYDNVLIDDEKDEEDDVGEYYDRRQTGEANELY